VVGDATLAAIPAAKVLDGLSPATVLLVRGADPAEVWRSRLAHRGPIVTLHATTPVDQDAAPSAIGVECAGAAARLLGVVQRATLADAVAQELRGQEDAAVERARRAALAAFDALEEHAGLVREGRAIPASGYDRPDWIAPSLDDVRLAAPDVHAPRTSELVRTGSWRTERPVIDYARCNRCSWICGTLCPDSAIAADAERTPHIDYEHCKGCMICVAVCPTHAIEAIAEPAGDGASP
jgi:pyruvate ferredoxin oxidoreductase gamma subunit